MSRQETRAARTASQIVQAIRAVGNCDYAANFCHATTAEVAQKLGIPNERALRHLQREAKKGTVVRLDQEGRTHRKGGVRGRLGLFQVWETTLEDEPVAGGGRRASEPDLNPFEQGYVEAALWSTSDDNDEALDKNYSVHDIALEVLAEMREDCARFIKLNMDDLEALSPDRAGALFWLNRNGHGSGFWDEDGLEKSAAERLDKSSEDFGPVDLYVGDDGFVHA